MNTYTYEDSETAKDRFNFVDEQVIHDENQIKNPEELRVGETYNVMSDLPNAQIRSLTVVSLDSLGEGIVKVKELNPPSKHMTAAEPREEDIHVTDHGLKPYAENGKWNSHYWLMRSK